MTAEALKIIRKIERPVKAVVFDAYGTLFDVHSAIRNVSAPVRQAEKVVSSPDRQAEGAWDATDPGDKAQAVSVLWRDKQLQYTWLRSLMGDYVPFHQITADGLDYALQTHGFATDGPLRDRLLAAYDRLSCYPEVPEVLEALRGAGFPTAILTNGSPQMIDAAVQNAGLTEAFDALLSVDSLQVYKPDPRVYQLACDRFEAAAAEIVFLSSNAWDVAGAAHFGFQVIHVNRFGQPPEGLPGEPLAIVRDLSPLPAMLAD